MRKYNLNYLIYSMLFFLLGALSLYRGEQIALVTSVVMSVLFIVIYFAHVILEKRESLTIRTEP